MLYMARHAWSYVHPKHMRSWVFSSLSVCTCFECSYQITSHEVDLSCYSINKWAYCDYKQLRSNCVEPATGSEENTNNVWSDLQRPIVRILFILNTQIPIAGSLSTIFLAIASIVYCTSTMVGGLQTCNFEKIQHPCQIGE